jgi:nucleoside-diphosphate-sugar epimerase
VPAVPCVFVKRYATRGFPISILCRLLSTSIPPTELPRIHLLGAGYIGLPTAIALQPHYAVQASYTREETCQKIREARIDPVFFSLNETSIEGDLRFLDVPILIVTLPFKRSLTDPFSYLRQIQQGVRPLSEQKCQVPWIIFTSSTSIYRPSSSPITEDDLVVPMTDRQAALYQAEQAIIQSGLPYTILRLGGIYGPGREIGKYSLNKSQIQDGPMNMVHRDDVVNVIREIIAKNATNQIFNVVSDDHPRKSEVYTRLAKKLGLFPPEFCQNTSLEKRVSNKKIRQLLRQKFKPISNERDAETIV